MGLCFLDTTYLMKVFSLLSLYRNWGNSRERIGVISSSYLCHHFQAQKATDFQRDKKQYPSPRFAWEISRTIFIHPTPERGDLGSLIANLVSRSKRSLPYQREVWWDCLYSRGHFSRTIFTPPNPLTGGILGSLVANLVFCSKRSLPYQREVWRNCLYGRGLFRETHKKRIAFCYPSCVERKTRLELATPTLARLCSTN